MSHCTIVCWVNTCFPASGLLKFNTIVYNIILFNKLINLTADPFTSDSSERTGRKLLFPLGLRPKLSFLSVQSLGGKKTWHDLVSHVGFWNKSAPLWTVSDPCESVQGDKPLLLLSYELKYKTFKNNSLLNFAQICQKSYWKCYPTGTPSKLFLKQLKHFTQMLSITQRRTCSRACK